MKRLLPGSLLLASLVLGACDGSTSSNSGPTPIDPADRAEVDADLRLLASDLEAIDVMGGIQGMQSAAAAGAGTGPTVAPRQTVVCPFPAIHSKIDENGAEVRDTIGYADENNNLLPGCPEYVPGAPIRMRMGMSSSLKSPTDTMRMAMSMITAMTNRPNSISMSFEMTGSMAFNSAEGYDVTIDPMTMQGTMTSVRQSDTAKFPPATGSYAIGFDISFMKGEYLIPLRMSMSLPEGEMSGGTADILRYGRKAGTMEFAPDGSVRIYDLDGNEIEGESLPD